LAVRSAVPRTGSEQPDANVHARASQPNPPVQRPPCPQARRGAPVHSAPLRACGVAATRLAVLSATYFLAGNSHGTSIAAANAAHRQCLQHVSSEDIRNAEALGGKQYVEEFLIERRGSLPTQVRRDGRRELREEDCAAVLQWAKDGQCVVSDLAEYQTTRMKQLDLRVFHHENYTKACALLSADSGAYGERAFRERVCVAPIHPPSRIASGTGAAASMPVPNAK